ncbi:unnamed protein product [Pleuronectes platessa]|uniref:Uncharacterized protein n=1 Tax=Pleuronectes platessa TaxID=8262 RepID=A0A9N7YNY0_PLEPL|nr:unnamed protein product [Pleuronectes platessa]
MSVVFTSRSSLCRTSEKPSDSADDRNLVLDELSTKKEENNCIKASPPPLPLPNPSPLLTHGLLSPTDHCSDLPPHPCDPPPTATGPFHSDNAPPTESFLPLTSLMTGFILSVLTPGRGCGSRLGPPPLCPLTCPADRGFPSSSSSFLTLSQPPRGGGWSVGSTQQNPERQRLPPYEHHLRPRVSHCSPTASWEPFSTQMGGNKDMHVQEEEVQEEEEEEAAGVFGKQRESRKGAATWEERKRRRGSGGEGRQQKGGSNAED